MTVEELQVIVSANKTDFDKKIKSVNSQLAQIKPTAAAAADSALSSFRGLASGIAALAIGDVIRRSLSFAGDLEQNIGGAKTVYADYAHYIEQTAKAAYDNLGLSESKYLATANKMGALFKGSGFSIAESADKTTKVMQRAADVASVMGISTDSAMESITGMAKGNFTMMDNLGVAINETNLQIYAQEKGLGKLETTQQKVNAAVDMFLEKTAYADGNFTRELSTYSGSLASFKAQLENLAAEAGTALLPLAQSIIPILRDGLQLLQPPIAAIAKGVDVLAMGVSSLHSMILSASPAQQNLLKIALGMAVAIPAVTVATQALTMAKAAYNGLLAVLIPKQLTFAAALKATMGWIALIASALSLLSMIRGQDSGNSEKQQADDLGKVAVNASDAAASYDDLTQSVTNTGKAVTKSLAGFDELNRIGGASSTLGSAIVSSDDVANAQQFSAAISEIEDTAISVGVETGSVYDDISDLWGWLTTDAYQMLSDAWDTVISIGADAVTLLFGNEQEKYNALVSLNSKVKNLFGDDFVNFWSSVGSDLYDITNGSISEQQRALQHLNNSFKSFFGEIGADWSDFWTDIGAGIHRIANGDVASGLRIINDKFKGLFGDLGADWSDFWTGIGSGIYAFCNGDLEKGLQLINDKFKGLFGELGKGWSDFWTGVGGGISDIVNAGAKHDADNYEKYGNAAHSATLASNHYMRNGYSPDDAWEKALADNGLNGEEGKLIASQFTDYDPEEAYKTLLRTGQIRFKRYASGGFPDYGDIFIANEKGPELVGTIGGRSAVANNNQITSAIYAAVKSAMDASNNTSQPGGDIHVTVEIDGEAVGEAVAQYNSIRMRRFNGKEG